MPYSIDFDHRLSGRTIHDAYATTAAWLQEEKADVKREQPPAYLEVAHGRKLQPMGWRKDARKTIVFEFQPSGPDVIVRARFIPAALNATDVRMRSEEARANWNELLAQLWERFGERGAMAAAIQRPPVDWNQSLQRGKGMLGAGVILVVAGLAIVLLFPKLYFAPIGFFVSGVLSLMYGGMTATSAKRRLTAQRGQFGR